MRNQELVDEADEQLLRISDVAKLTTLSKSSINLWVAQGKFVKPIILSPTIKVWRQKDIIAWISAKKLEARKFTFEK